MNATDPTDREAEDLIVAEAKAALAKAKDWTASPALWERVSRIADRMAAALAEGDFAALDAAAAELERISPDRVIKVGSKDAPEDGEKAPKPVFERMNHLIHQLEAPIEDAKKAGVTDSEASRGK